MPLTLESFIEQEPTLLALRRALANCDRHAKRQLTADERALVQMLEGRWNAGVAGWMTTEEAAQVAVELVALAAEMRLGATVTVADGYLVFSGSRYGRQCLALAATSPVRARKHWLGYLEACPRQLPEQQELLGGGSER